MNNTKKIYQIIFTVLLLLNLIHATHAEEKIIEPDNCMQKLALDLNVASESKDENNPNYNSPEAWDTYAHQTADSITPQRTLMIALDYYQKDQKKSGNAVDLGSGTGKDTLYLLKNKWNVLAIDFSAKAIEILEKRSESYSTQLQTEVVDFLEMELPDHIDLINATYSLPFVAPNQFLQVWNNIDEHLRSGGYFVGNFFGTDDDFSEVNNQVTILSEQQIRCLFRHYNIKYFQERKINSNNINGQQKHWHIWDVVAKKD